VDDEKLRSWRIRIHGLVENEVSLSIADLKAKFDVVTLPITLVCAGNRRKEQNVVRKSLGKC
jgi:nitrate reductase (NAD(P)H)